MPLLSVNNLDVSYGAIQALHDVSLSIDRGEVVTLIGSNGAGKPTLLRTISGLLRPTRGTITWAGGAGDAPGPRVLQALPPHQIVRLGVSHVPEGRQIFGNLTVEENLRLGAYQRRDRAEVAAGIERCNQLFPVLAERRRQKGGTLSGGEQQMLAIGRALMARPQLLLLDEPSLGLAPMIVRRIFQIIREINAEGTTIFLVEQNAHMALSVAHRGYVLQSGRVIRSDAAARLLEDPQVKAAYLGG
jgi:branched-chain amino acid transport system ATP-binding protein